MYLIVGLGNPGKEYEKTRHNMGFCQIDRFAQSHHVSFLKENHAALPCAGAEPARG